MKFKEVVFQIASELLGTPHTELARRMKTIFEVHPELDLDVTEQQAQKLLVAGLTDPSGFLEWLECGELRLDSRAGRA